MNYIAKEIKTGRIIDNVIYTDLGDVREDKFYISKITIDGVDYVSKTPKGKSNNINKKRWKTDLNNMKNFGFELGECAWFREDM